MHSWRFLLAREEGPARTVERERRRDFERVEVVDEPSVLPPRELGIQSSREWARECGVSEMEGV